MSRARREVKSATFNELDKLVNLQISLADTENLLDEAVQKCDRLIEEDKCGELLRREASERVYHLQCLQEQRDHLDDNLKSARESLDRRKEQLRHRRMRLAEAHALHEEDLLTEFEAGSDSAEQKKRVHALKRRIEPVRASLLSTVSFIFPIELLSPPDLLYTILSVPLPIPLQGSDPAPPLFLSKFPSINEDSVATALGYAALVVHLMAAYLCRGLTYPITYVGSRSLVKDPISAMMGPRMFPLYSKGVDTYRFEYAVFLLNKDIELLMADRNLRALDLRHTLPNLKNLLLTLTSGESALAKSRPLASPSIISISSGLQSPTIVSTEAGDPPLLSLDDRSATPKQSQSQLPSVSEGNMVSGENPNNIADSITNEDSTPSQPANDSDSPASTVRARMPRIQIQSYLPPLSSIWRSRNPSSSVSGKTEEGLLTAAGSSADSSPLDSAGSSSSDGSTAVSSETSDEGNGSSKEESEEVGEEGNSDDEDEDDRRTVRGASVPTTPIAETRSDRAFGTALDSLKEQIRGTGGRARKAMSDREAGSEKHANAAPTRTPPLTR